MALRYREFPAPGPLTDFVDSFWSLQGRAGAALPGRPLGGSHAEPVLPDGCPELVLNLADPFLRHGSSGPPRRQPASLLVGQLTSPIVLQPTGAVDLIGVRFRPSGLGGVLRGLPAAELTDGDFDLEEIVGARAKGVAEMLHHDGTPARRVAALATWFRRALLHNRRPDPVARRAEEAIRSAHGRLRIDALAASMGVSRRHLERRFHGSVGIGPKLLARIARFQHLVRSLDRSDSPRWAGLAVQCGYYDQAHLIRDFRQFTGESPAAFLGAEHSLAELFTHGHAGERRAGSRVAFFQDGPLQTP